MSAASSSFSGSKAAGTVLGTKHVNVVFSDEQYEQLRQLAVRQNITLADALRQAIGVASLVVNASADPNTKILFKTGDSVQELTFS